MGVWERRYYRVLNAVMRVLLRSPLHRLRSRRVLLLEFTGRRSGRRYRMPVSYWEREPGRIVCLTSATWSQWWINLDEADVVLALRGGTRAGRAALVRDPRLRQTLVAGFLRHNAHDAKHYGVERDGAGRPLDHAVRALAEAPETKVVDIRLTRWRPGPPGAEASP